MKSILLLTCCLPITVAFAQKITLHGMTPDVGSNKPLPEVSVFLVHGDDTVASVISDSLGRYAFPDLLIPSDDHYTVKSTPFCRFPQSVSLTLSELNYDADVNIDLTFSRKMDCPNMNSLPYFAEKDAKTVLNFEAEPLQQLLKEFPDLIFVFCIIQLPGESKSLGRKRMRTFRRLLETEKIPPGRVCLLKKVGYYTPQQLTEGPRSAVIQATSSLSEE